MPLLVLFFSSLFVAVAGAGGDGDAVYEAGADGLFSESGNGMPVAILGCLRCRRFVYFRFVESQICNYSRSQSSRISVSVCVRRVTVTDIRACLRFPL